MTQSINKILLFSLSLFSLTGLLRAQEQLQQPLAFIPADSVVVWGGDYGDIRGMALLVDPSLTERPVKVNASAFADELAAWQKDWLPTMTVTGAGGYDARTSCAVRNSQMVGTAASLFLQTGHADFMEAIERALFNDLLHETTSPGQLSFDKRLAAQTLVNGTGMIYAISGNDVWVNLFVNNTCHIRTPNYNLIIDQITTMPFNGTVKVRVSGIPRGGYPLRIHLRLPHWASAQGFPSDRYSLSGGVRQQRPTVYVNGRDPLKISYENGYAVVDREWNRGDEILVNFPLEVQYVHRKAAAGSQPSTDVAIQSGPLLYVVPDSCERGLLSPTIPLREDYDGMGLRFYSGTYGTTNYLTGSPVTFSALPYLRSDGRIWLPMSGQSATAKP